MTNLSDEAKELAWISRAYFDAARHLCESMCEDDFSDSYLHNRVPLYLCHHSLELLYKSALLTAGEPYSRTHDVAVLRAACIQRFPDCRFPIPPWLGGEHTHTENLFDDLPVMYFENLNERYRYFSDSKGRPLQMVPVVKSKDLAEELSALERASYPAFLRLTGLTKNTP